ncbi:MAG: putative Ig domain-containing protein [archaeon]
MRRKTKITLGIVACAILIASIILVYALNFQSGPSILPVAAQTNDSLICRWTATGQNIKANVSWYINGALNKTEIGISCTSGVACQTPDGINNTYVQRYDIWNCTVLLYNGTTNNTRSVIKTIKNADPQIHFIPTQQLTEDVLYTYDVNASDPDEPGVIDGDNVTYPYSANGLFTSDELNQNTGVISFTPVQVDVGEYNITLVVLDGETGDNIGSDAIEVIFNVTEVNDVPYFNPALTDQTATEDQSFTYSITGADEENDPFNFTMSSGLGNRLVINVTSNTTADIYFNTANKAPDWQDRGNYTVTVTIWDTNNNSINSTSSFNLEVVPVNQVPIITGYTTGNWSQGDNFTFWINATDTNVNDTLTFTLSAPLCSLSSLPWNITTVDNSANATGLINITLNNNHVVCRNITITVSDSVGTDQVALNFNINNTNDLPVIHNTSSFVNNSGANTNINDLFGAVGIVFTYKINATDIDQLTYEDDTLTYCTNNTNFSIDNTTGIISLTPNSSLIGNWSILVNVTDSKNGTDSAVLSIRIINNTAPSIVNITNITCTQNSSCTGYIRVIDPDIDDNISFTSNNTDIFALIYYNATAARYSFTPDNDEVGTYSIFISVSDMVGAGDNTTFFLYINNMNDAPFWDNNLDGTPDTLRLGTFIVNQTINYRINATDIDIMHGDNIYFTSSILVGDASLFTLSDKTNNSALISCTPTAAQAGNYQVIFTVRDDALTEDNQTINFTVHNASVKPVIHTIKPYQNTTTNITVFDFGNTSMFTNSRTHINFTENRSVVFNVTYTDNDTNIENLTIFWYYDSVLNQTIDAIDNISLNLSFSFYTNGTHNVSIQIQDNFKSEAWWHWILNVTNINRPPLLLVNPINYTGAYALTSQLTVLNYLGYYDGIQRFIDPDDDLNENNKIANSISDPNEVNRLTYTSTYCSVATISITSDDVTFTPTQIGTCTVNFTASDGQYNITSTPVAIEVTHVPQSNAGSTSTSRTRTVTEQTPVPIPQEVQKPVLLKIITPTTVTIYKNRKMVIPIRIRNNWNDTLYGISISAEANETDAQVDVSTDYFPTLTVGQEERFNLTVTNYRENGHYELQILANVTEPKYFDVATILVNSIESRDKGKEVDIKITFAQDLLTRNAECQELNELLDKARLKSYEEDYDTALQYVDLAINGCKYLMSRKELDSNKETPKSFVLMLGENLQIVKLVGAILGILALGVVIYEVVDKIKETKKEKKNRPDA